MKIICEEAGSYDFRKDSNFFNNILIRMIWEVSNLMIYHLKLQNEFDHTEN